MWLIPFKNILCRKSQSIFTIIITSITIFVFVSSLAVFINLQNGIELSKNRLGANIIVLPNNSTTGISDTIFTAKPENTYMNKNILDKISSINTIENITPQFFTQTLSGGCCSYGENIRLVGYDEKTDFMLKPWFDKQSFNKLKDNEVIIGSKVEAFLGNKVAILGYPFKVVGTLYPTGSGMDETIYMNINVARSLALEEEDLKAFFKEDNPKNLISAIYIKTKANVKPENTVNEINKLNLSVKAYSTSETIEGLKSQINSIGIIIIWFFISIILISSLSLIGRFNSTANQRKKEIGILRAIGVQKSGIAKIILVEALTLSFIGGFIGSFIGIVFMNPILSFLSDNFKLPTGNLNIGYFIIFLISGIIVSMILGIIASIYPLLKSVKLEPQEAIAKGEVE